MLWLSIIWLVFATMFFVLGYYQWKIKDKKVPYLSIPQRPTIPGVIISVSMAGEDIDNPLKRFATEVNNFVDEYNKSTNKEHKNQAMGYWVASATAILSLVLVVVT